MLNEGSSAVLALVCITSPGEAACHSTQSLVSVSAEQHSKAQTFKLFKHTRNPIQLVGGEHMHESCTGQRMPPCPTVYALATLVFLHMCLLCHLTTILSIFSNCFLFQLLQSTLAKATFSLILSLPCPDVSSPQESILHFWLFPARGQQVDGVQAQAPCCCLHSPA